MNLAAIDVGSNAIRMGVGRVTVEEDGLEIVESTRLPVRLGKDAFTTGQLSESTMQAAVDAFIRFRTIADQFGVNQIRAVATSALREAENGELSLIGLLGRQAFRLTLLMDEPQLILPQLII